jgi:signal transduction histidine kinase
LLSRAVGEIAVNARRHGGASTLVISVIVEGAHCRVVCEDDGAGMAESTAPGLGSRLLDETTAALGGSWTIDSLETGCRVTVDVLLRAPLGGAARARVPASSGA